MFEKLTNFEELKQKKNIQCACCGSKAKFMLERGGLLNILFECDRRIVLSPYNGVVKDYRCRNVLLAETSYVTQ